MRVSRHDSLYVFGRDGDIGGRDNPANAIPIVNGTGCYIAAALSETVKDLAGNREV